MYKHTSVNYTSITDISNPIKSKTINKQRQCSYCSNSGHRIESCPLRLSHLSECNNHSIKTRNECDELIDRMGKDMPIYDPIREDKNISVNVIMSGSRPKTNIKSLRIHGCYSNNYSANGYGVLEPNQMTF